jgi:YVTN family beta-propeller protein
VNPGAPTVYVTQDYANTVMAINGQTNTVTATFAAGHSAEAIAITVSRRLGAIFVTGAGKYGRRGTVSVISQRYDKIKATIKVGHSPFGIAVNGLTRTGYVINEDDSTVSVIALCRNSHTSFHRTLLSAVRLSRSAS